MDKKQINALHKKIVKQIYAGKLFGAFSDIKSQEIASRDSNYSSLIMAEDTYKLMLKYSVKGINDKNKAKIFRQLQISLLYSVDILRYLLMTKFYPSYLFSNKNIKGPEDVPTDKNAIQWFEFLIKNTSIDNQYVELLLQAKSAKNFLGRIFR